MRGSEFDWETLVDQYIAVSNERDLDGFFELVHPGVAYFDAFWRETCVGRDLRQYMEDWYAIDQYHYSRVGKVIETGDGAAFRYSAVDVNAPTLDEATYTGSEVLTVQDGKIITISDYYCDPSTEAIVEVIKTSASRHGQPSYATAGYSAARMSGLREQLLSMSRTGELHSDPDLTVYQLAKMVGCTPRQLILLATGRISPDNEAEEARLFAAPASEIVRQIG